MRADRDTDALYAGMRRRFGTRRAAANGYRYEGYFRREQALLLSLLDADAAIVLDVACGSGLMLEPLRDGTRLVLGLDFNADACAAARANGAPVVRGDAFALPFADGSVDQIVNCQFFNQQPRAGVQRFVAEVARVLRPGGAAVLVWRNAESGIHRIAHALLTALDRVRGLPEFPQESHPLADVAQVVAQAGLVAEHREVSCPPLGWRSVAIDGVLARLIGASCVLVVRKPAASTT